MATSDVGRLPEGGSPPLPLPVAQRGVVPVLEPNAAGTADSGPLPTPPAPVAIGPTAIDLRAIGLPPEVLAGLTDDVPPLARLESLVALIHPVAGQVDGAFVESAHAPAGQAMVLSPGNEQAILTAIIDLASRNRQDAALQLEVINRFGSILSVLKGPSPLLPVIMEFLLTRVAECRDLETAQALMSALGQVALLPSQDELFVYQRDAANTMLVLQRRFPGSEAGVVRAFVDQIRQLVSHHAWLFAPLLMTTLRNSTDAGLRRQVLDFVVGLAGKYLEVNPADGDLALADVFLWPLLQSAQRKLDGPIAAQNGEWAVFCGLELLFQPPVEASALRKLPRRLMAKFEEARRCGCDMPEGFRQSAVRVAHSYTGEPVEGGEHATYLEVLQREAVRYIGGSLEGELTVDQAFRMCIYTPGRLRVAERLAEVDPLTREIRPQLPGVRERLLPPGFFEEWSAPTTTIGRRLALLETVETVNTAVVAPMLFPVLAGWGPGSKTGQALLDKGLNRWTLQERKLALLFEVTGNGVFPIKGFGRTRVTNKSFALIENVRISDLKTAGPDGLSPADKVNGLIESHNLRNLIAFWIVIASAVILIVAALAAVVVVAPILGKGLALGSLTLVVSSAPAGLLFSSIFLFIMRFKMD